MDTKVLETFITVAEAGGLSSAGSMLGISQSIISRRIKELESECRAPLLYRHGRGVRLTPAGESFYEALRPLVAQYSAIVASIAEQESMASGVVTLAMSPSFMSAAGLPLLDAMKASYPNVTLRLVSGYSRYIYEWLTQARVDMGVLSDIGMSAQILLEELGAVPVVFCAHAGMTLPEEMSAAESVEIGAVGSTPLALPTQGQGLRRYLDVAASKSNVVLNIAYEVDDIDLTKQLVATGRAATFLPRYAVKRELARGELIERRIGAGHLRARSVLATARNRQVTPAMKVAIRVLKEVAAATFHDSSGDV